MISSSPKICPQCGTVLSSRASGELCPNCVGRFALAGFGEERTQPAFVGLSFGDFQLIEEIGRGAMGAVFRARQTSLNREVAVKIVLAGEFAGESERKRFLAEAETVARLDHPHIVPVYAVGEHDHRQFYAMKLVPGARLADRVADFKSPRAAAGLVAMLADAVHHAHQRGVLHRDLKPANVLLDERGEPHITDFGLARRLDQDGGLTLTGSPLGTPAYMSPEQATGAVEPTTASDIYSLGAILYELLAGQPPFTGKSVPEVLRRIVEEEPPEGPLAFLRKSGQRDILVICLKCLAKDPAQRYASAAALREDLLAWLEHRPIQAKPARLAERLILWSRRRPTIAALSLSVLGLTLLILAGAALAAFHLFEAGKREEAAHEEARQQLYRALVSQARALRMTREPGRRIEGLRAIKQAASIKVTDELRDEAIAQLALLDHSPTTNATSYVYWGQAPAVRPQFDWIAESVREGYVRLREYASSNEVCRWRPSETNQICQPIRFSGDGKWLAVQTPPKELWMLKVEGRSLTPAFHIPGGSFGAFNPNSKLLASLVDEREMGIYSLEDGQRLAVRSLPPRSRNNAAFHPSGEVSLLAMLEKNQTIVWDWERDIVCERLSHEFAPWDLAWTSDFLATGLEDGSLRLWNLRSRRMRTFREHSAVLSVIRTPPDERWLITRSYDSSSIWWDLIRGVPVLRDVSLYPTHFKNDGTAVMLTGFGSSAPASILKPSGFAELLSPEATGFNASPDGRWICTTARERLEIFELAGLRRILSTSFPNLIAAAFSESGSQLYVCTRREVSEFQIEPGSSGVVLRSPRLLYRPPAPDLEAIWVDAPRKRILISGGMERFIAVSTEDGQVLRSLPGAVIPRHPRCSPDGRWFAAGTFHGHGARVWNATNDSLSKWLHTGNSTVGFSPDGKFLYSAASHKLLVYETGTWRIVHQEDSDSGTSLPSSADWSPDGRFLLFPRKASEIVLLGTGDWNPAARLAPPGSPMMSNVRCDPSGQRILALGGEGAVYIWDLSVITRELGALGIAWKPPAAAPVASTAAKLAGITPLKIQAALPPAFKLPIEAPPRPAGASPGQLDLGNFYNATLDQDWHSNGNADHNLSTLGAGLREIDGVLFDIRGIVQLGSKALPPEKFGYPAAVRNIPVGQPVRTLHFLVGCGWGSGPAGEIAGRFVMHLQNGQTNELALRMDQNISDWWGPSSEGSKVKSAYQGKTADGNSFRLFQVVWVNPAPDVPVSSFDFQGAMKTAAPFLIAVTAE